MGKNRLLRESVSAPSGALSSQGLVTALCVEGTLNGTVFLYFLEHFLCPPLKPGQVVMMDNASPHKVEEVAELIEETGAELLLILNKVLLKLFINFET